MRFIDRNTMEGFLMGVVFAGIPCWYVVDAFDRVDRAMQRCNKQAEEFQRELSEMSGTLSEIHRDITKEK